MRVFSRLWRLFLTPNLNNSVQAKVEDISLTLKQVTYNDQVLSAVVVRKSSQSFENKCKFTQEHIEDALADMADEGRGSLR